MATRVKFETVDTLRSVATAPVSSKGRGRPVADLVEYFEKADSNFGRKYGLSSAALRAGDIIRTMRKAAGLSQADLAQRMSATVTQARISELEAGTGSQGPTWDVMERIAAACGVRLIPNFSARGEDSALASKVEAGFPPRRAARSGKTMINSPFEITSELRDFADRSVEQARKVFEGFLSVAQKTAGAAGEAPGAGGVKSVGAHVLTYTEQNVNAAFDLAHKLVRAKDPQEAFALQSEYMKSQLAALQAQAKELGTLFQKSMTPGSN